MVFTKSYRRKRRSFVKRRRMGGPISMRRRPRPMTAGRVKKIIGAELKVSQIDIRDMVTNAAAPLLLQITGLAQGDAQDEREGNRIQGVNLHGHVTLQGDPVGGGQDITDCRVAIFRWNEDISGVQPTGADIMQDITQLGSSYNINNRGQFKILWSRYFTIVNSDDNPAFRRTLRFYTKLTGPKILFDGAGGGAATAKKYHIYFMVLTNSPDVGHPILTLNTTFRYTDS